MGAKNNDSTSEKQAIVKIYTMEYRKCGNFNSKNDSRPCMGASAFLKSVDFTAFEINVKTIAPTQKLYQSGHAIWWHTAPMTVGTFLERYDWTGKTIYPVSQSASMDRSQYEESVSFIRSCAGNATVDAGIFSKDNTEIMNYISSNVMK